MNVKEIARLMDKKKAYWWSIGRNGGYILQSTEGRKIFSTAERYEAEVATKKLRSMKMNIVGDVPAMRIFEELGVRS